jgi:hypothetical protein
MGVKNYYFHLALFDPTLQGVDPFSPDLTAEQIFRIQREIKTNPWYYFREIARIPDGNNPVQFRLTRPILALFWCIFVGITFFLIMPRQIGKTAAMTHMHNYLRDFYYRNRSTFLFTKSSKLLKETIGDMKAYQDLYPPLITPVIKHGKNKDADNYEIVTCNMWNNTTATDIGHEPVVAAENVARGGKYPFIHADEPCWTVNAHLSIPQMQFATGAYREQAEANGEINCDVYTSTPGYLDTPHGAYAYSMLMAGMYWNDRLYDCNDKCEARAMVISNSPSGKCIINGTFNHRQSGKDDAWLRNRISKTTADIENIENNLLNKWSKGSLAMLLTKKQVDIVSRSEMDILYTDVSSDKFLFDWFIEESEIASFMANGQFGIGLDTSQIVGQDANGLVLLDFKDLAVVARCRVTVGNIFTYVEWLVAVLIAYPTITLIIENKQSAQSMLDITVLRLIEAGIDPFKRIYNRVVSEHESMPDDYEFIKLNWRNPATYTTYKHLFGFCTNKGNRQFLYDTVIQNALDSAGHVVRDPQLSEELRGLIVKNRRVDHAKGGHDDLVFGWMLAHWFIKHSKNLQYYGITSSYALSMVSDNGAVLTTHELANRCTANILKLEINKLKEGLKQSTSVIENLRDEKILAIKLNELKLTGDTSLSLDSIMTEITENKAGRNNLRNSMVKLQQQRMYHRR